jgi:hypothetical protein
MTIKIYFIRKFRVLLLASSFLLMLAGCSSALHVAAEKGNVKEVLECIDNGADVNGKQGKMQYTPLWYAASEGHADVARLLITRGADVNARPLQVPAGISMWLKCCLRKEQMSTRGAPIVRLH